MNKIKKILLYGVIIFFYPNILYGFQNIKFFDSAFNEFIAKIIESNIDLQILDSERKKSKLEIELKQSEFKPSISMIGNITKQADERAVGTSVYNELEYSTDKTQSEKINAGIQITQKFQNGINFKVVGNAGTNKFSSLVYEDIDSANSIFSAELSKNIFKNAGDIEIKKLFLKYKYDNAAYIEKKNQIYQNALIVFQAYIQSCIKYNLIKSNIKDAMKLKELIENRVKKGIAAAAELLKIKFKLNELQLSQNESKIEMERNLSSLIITAGGEKKNIKNSILNLANFFTENSGILNDEEKNNSTLKNTEIKSKLSEMIKYLDNIEIENRIEIQKFDLQKKIIESDKKLDIKKFMPDLILSGSYTLLKSGDSIGDIFGGFDKRWFSGVQISIPILPQISKSFIKNEYDFSLKILELSRIKTIWELKNEILHKRLELNNIIQSIDIFSENLIIAEENRIIAEKLYIPE